MMTPFGRYRGASLRELPDDYLDWLAKLPNLREPLLSAVIEKVGRRSYEAPAYETDFGPAPRIRSVDRSKSSWNAAPEPRPAFTIFDAGGGAGVLQQLNALAESLRSQLTSLEGRYMPAGFSAPSRRR